MRLIFPVILIGLAITIFFTFTEPLYSELSYLRSQAASYDEALNNSKALESERDKLTQKYNSIGGENLERLRKMVPENVDNIRLILEIEKIAEPYGMTLRDVKYSSETVAPEDPGVITGGVAAYQSQDYGVWDLEFQTNGTYTDFVNFLKDLERNLRIVDISSIEFSSEVAVGPAGTPAEGYQYQFHVKTYWLKN